MKVRIEFDTATASPKVVEAADVLLEELAKDSSRKWAEEYKVASRLIVEALDRAAAEGSDCAIAAFRAFVLYRAAGTPPAEISALLDEQRTRRTGEFEGIP